MLFNVGECVRSCLPSWTLRSGQKASGRLRCTFGILPEHPEMRGEGRCCRQGAGRGDTAGGSWSTGSFQQHPGARCRGCSKAGQPVEHSQRHSSSLPSQGGRREQFHGPQSTAAALPSSTRAALCVLQPDVLGSLLQQLSWGPCPVHLSLPAVSCGPRLTEDEGLLQQRIQTPFPTQSDLVTITRNARKAFSPLDRLSRWPGTDVEISL